MLLKILKAVLVILVIFGAIGLLLPAKFRVERTLEMSGLPYDFVAVVSDLESWPKWSAWNEERDPSLKWTFSTDAKSEGSFMRWNGKQLGKGTMKIARIDEDEGTVEFDLLFSDAPPSKIILHADEVPDRVRLINVSWVNEGDLGWNPVYRWVGFFLMDRWIGKDFETGLTNLRKVMREL